MNHNNEKITQRQRICHGCKSFVTHEKNDDDQFACPLCGHCLKPTPNLNKPIKVRASRAHIKKFYEAAYQKIKSQSK